MANTNVLSGERLGRLDSRRARPESRRRRAGPDLEHAHRNGDRANISRNVFEPGGRTDPDALRTHEAVVEAQRAAIEHLVPGETLGKAARAADGVWRVTTCWTRRCTGCSAVWGCV